MLAFEGVSRVYRDGGSVRRALDRVSFRLGAGELVALVGENGAGKTTLLRVAATLEPPTGGRVVVAGLDARAEGAAVRRRLAWAGQEPGLYPALTVRENLAFVAAFHGREADVEEAAKAAGVARLLDARAGALSRGERQRAALARALVQGDVLLLDEPTTALDDDGRARVADLLRALRGKRTVLVATHDAGLAAACDRALRLHAGRLVEGAA